MRPIRKLAAKLALLLIPFPLIVAVAMYRFPMQFSDSAYGIFLRHKEYTTQPQQYCRVLVLGNCLAEAAVHPDLLSDDTDNFALAGMTSLEAYYSLREYLEHNEAPEYVFYIPSLGEWAGSEAFWTRYMFFHHFDDDDLADIQERLTQFSDISAMGVADIKEFAKEVQLYRMYAPQKYSATFLKSLLENLFGGKHYKNNLKVYQRIVENKGQSFTGTAECCDEADLGLTRMEGFSISEIMDWYFRAMIELCEENEIQFVFQNPPYNTSTHLQEAVVEEYKAYLEGVQKDYSDAMIDANIYYYGPECFGDPSHVNQRGMEQYCSQMVQRYPEIFQKRKSAGSL